MGNPSKCFKLRSWLKEILLSVVRFLISFLRFVDETWEKVRKQLCDQYSAESLEKIPIPTLIFDSAQESLRMFKWGAAMTLQPGVEGCKSLRIPSAPPRVNYL